uniref:Uncharacterized protein n=1 Tax=Arundo donax TaxID=35708 RepID=A0A0A8YUV0_ARUDO
MRSWPVYEYVCASVSCITNRSVWEIMMNE